MNRTCDERSAPCTEYDASRPRRAVVFRINVALGRQAVPCTLNEAWIERHLSLLIEGADQRLPEYWLMIARLAEAALLCAGHYADNGVFSAAGDLLVNPRRVVIYQKRYRRPITKPRHGSVSGALGISGLPANIRRRRLRFETMIQREKQALLPELLEVMSNSRRLSRSYLATVHTRMTRVAETIGFLAAWGLADGDDLHRRLKQEPTGTRRYVLSQCCGFDDTTYKELGRAIDRLRPSCLREVPTTPAEPQLSGPIRKYDG